MSNFKILMTSYPSGIRVNSLLASKCFGVKQENILVGNGAAELIKALAERLNAEVTGIVSPSFDEYSHRITANLKIFKSSRNDFSYSAEDLMHYFEKNPVSQIVLINPDNPSGNFIPFLKVRELVKWCKEKQIKLIIDESFLDFSDENAMLDKTALNKEILDTYKYVYVIKSISKSYGVPGLRLGILASSDTEMIADLKKAVSIWNINSFGEYYLQLSGKYRKDYIESLNKIRNARANLMRNLDEIDYLDVFPSQANFVMCEITEKSMSASSLAQWCLQKNILIKNLTQKVNNGRQYIRIAVRDEKDNAKLIETLKEYDRCQLEKYSSR